MMSEVKFLYCNEKKEEKATWSVNESRAYESWRGLEFHERKPLEECIKKLTRNNKLLKYSLITDVERIRFFAGLLTEFHICYTTGQAVALWDHKVGKNSHSGSAVCGVTHKKVSGSKSQWKVKK